MKYLVLMGFFLCLYLHFYFGGSVEHDSLNTTQAAIQKDLPKVSTALKKVSHAPSTLVTNEASVTNEEESISPADEPSFVAESDYAIPWDEVEEGWKTELKAYLLEVDPEGGEDMFNAYLEEKKKFAERVDTSERSVETADGEASRSLAVVEYDARSEEIERAHQDNLKDIFGEHYSAIKSLHSDYVESVQYLNRSDVQFSISL
jgi:hypothetical protein